LASLNTDPQLDSILTKGPADLLDRAASETAVGTRLGIDATKKLLREGYNNPWPSLIRTDETVRANLVELLKP
jgi:4-hydroxy-3-polyprenylbenzoate decarboxylase